jgi:hypothetical protein
VPLLLVLAIVAVGTALAISLNRSDTQRGSRFVVTAAGVWVALLVLALVVVTVATLIFGR